MKTKKLALYTGVGAILIGAGATTLALQADESAQPSGALAQSGEAGQAITIFSIDECDTLPNRLTGFALNEIGRSEFDIFFC